MSWETLTDLTLHGWYKADAITGLSNGDPVSTWSDSSGLGRDISQALTARPSLVTNAKNSLPAVEFDGTNDQLNSDVWVANSIDSICCTIAVELDSIKNYNGFFAIDSNQIPVYHSDFFHAMGYVDGAVLVGRAVNGSGSYILSTLPDQARQSLQTGWQIVSVTYRPGQRFIRINGLDVFPRAFVNHPATHSGNAYTSIGYNGLSGSFLDGKIAELVLFDSDSNNEHVWVEGYLSHKYAITLTAGHAFKDAAPESAPPTLNAGGSAGFTGVRGLSLRLGT